VLLYFVVLTILKSQFANCFSYTLTGLKPVIVGRFREYLLHYGIGMPIHLLIDSPRVLSEQTKEHEGAAI